MKNKTNLENTNPKSLIAELIFLACLCIIALRATFTEGIQLSSTTPQLNSIVVSLTFSFILIVLFAFWCYRLIFSAKLTYRFTAIEIPLILFLIAAGVSVYFASNKRLAINSLVILTSPVMLAVLLIQITDRPSKVKILLIVIAALGFLSTVQCLNQLFSDNNMAVQQYQQDPESMLKPLGISKGTFQQFLFEHRLYSKGINSVWNKEMAEVNPIDAEKLGLVTGSKVRVTSRRGTADTHVKVTDRVLPGVIWMSFHYNATPTNALTSHHLDPITGTGEYKVAAVKIEKLQEVNQ